MANSAISRFLSPLSLWRHSWVFVGDWIRSRRWKCLLWGFPAALVIGATIGAIVWRAQITTFELKKRYGASTDRALRAEDHDEADLCLRKLINLDPEEDLRRYQLALVHIERDDRERGKELMKEIAPLGQQNGYAPAHFWLATDLVKEKERLKEQLEPKDVELVKSHLKKTVLGQPDHVDANAMLGQLFLQEREFERAAQHLARAVQRRPELRLILAKAYVANGERAKASDEARASAEFFSRLVEANGSNVLARIAWAKSTLFLEQFEQTVLIVRQGLELEPDNNRLRMTLAQVYLVWSDLTPVTNLERKMQLLQMALSYAPDNPMVIGRLAPLASKTNPKWQEVRAKLEDILARGKARATIHFILGTLASEEQDYDKAGFHLEQAYKENPRMAAVANNLAWVLARVDPPQYDRALKLCNAAIEAAPSSHSIRETRGVIYLKMENWEAAISDLEAVLNFLPAQQKSIHLNLATAYEKLSQPQLAKRHRELAKD